MDVITKSFPIYCLGGWGLSELLPDASETAVAARLANLEAATAAFERCRADLVPGMDPQRFLEILQEYKEVNDLISVISGYSSLRFHADTASQEALSLKNRV